MTFRTDLALEHCGNEITLPDGVSLSRRQHSNITIEAVKIQSENYLKPPGRYVTVTTPPLAAPHMLDDDELEAIATELADMLPETGTVLVAGLGNSDITPDAIGPRCAGQILATRHLDDEAEQLLGELRPVAVISPGVLGQTGMEAAEIVRALTEQLSPSAVIVIDALAAQSGIRLGRTIQLADSGISPGSGVMNTRRELSQKTLGVPVIAVGVPTVVDAAALAGEEEAKVSGMMVTPRDIDQLITHACRTLAIIINRALQRTLPRDIIPYLMG